jgi:hypothetical protein
MTTGSGLLEAMRTRLVADAAIAALAGERVFAFTAPEGAAFPCLIVSVPELDLPDDAYAPTLDATVDVMAVGRSWGPVETLASRVRALMATPLAVAGVHMADMRTAGTVFYAEREGRDTLYYGTTRLAARYTE